MPITRSIFVRVTIGAWCLALICAKYRCGANIRGTQVDRRRRRCRLPGNHMFRGVRQNATPMAMWPFGDLGIATHRRGGAFNGLDIHAGVWNSLQTGDRIGRTDAPALVRIGFVHHCRPPVRARHTPRHDVPDVPNPNSMFTTVNEMSLSLHRTSR